MPAVISVGKTVGVCPGRGIVILKGLAGVTVVYFSIGYQVPQRRHGTKTPYLAQLEKSLTVRFVRRSVQSQAATSTGCPIAFRERVTGTMRGSGDQKVPGLIYFQ